MQETTISEFRENIRKHLDALRLGEQERLYISQRGRDYFELRHVPDYRPGKTIRFGLLTGKGDVTQEGIDAGAEEINSDFEDYI